MAKRSKKQSDKPVADTGEPMFPVIGTEMSEPAPEGDEFMPGYKTREDAQKAFEEMRAANERYQADTAALRAQQETMQGVLDQLSAGGGKPGSQPQAAPEPLDLTKLPDPVEDREGFTKGVMGAVDRLVKDQLAAQAAADTQTKNYDAVWNEFKDAHEDLAEHEEILEAAARQVITEQAAKGVDPQRLMLGNKKRFFSLVADNANQRIERLKKSFGVRDDDEGDGDSLRGGEPVRDVGLSNSSRGRPTPDTSAPKLGSLIDDLKKAQRSSGFF